MLHLRADAVCLIAANVRKVELPSAGTGRRAVGLDDHVAFFRAGGLGRSFGTRGPRFHLFQRDPALFRFGRLRRTNDAAEREHNNGNENRPMPLQAGAGSTNANWRGMAHGKAPRKFEGSILIGNRDRTKTISYHVGDLRVYYVAISPRRAAKSSFPRSAWERTLSTLPRRGGANQCCHLNLCRGTPERPDRAFPRGAWERDFETLLLFHLHRPSVRLAANQGNLFYHRRLLAIANGDPIIAQETAHAGRAVGAGLHAGGGPPMRP